MTDANRTQVGYFRETIPGTIPATPEIQTLRITSAPDLGAQPNTVRSNEIAADRQVSDLILVGISAGGGVGVELSYGNMYDIWETILFNAWTILPIVENKVPGSEEITSVDTTTTSDINVTAGGDSFLAQMLIRNSGFNSPNGLNDGVFQVASSAPTSITVSSGLEDQTTIPSTARTKQCGFKGDAGDLEIVTSPANGLQSTGLDFTTMGIAVGSTIKIGDSADAGSAFDTAELNTYYRVASVTANLVTFDTVPAGFVADAGTGKTITVWIGDFNENGVTPFSFGLEEQFQAHSPVTYQYLLGQQVDNYTETLDTQSIVTGQLTFMGMDQNYNMGDGSGRAPGAIDIAAPTNQVVNTSSNVADLQENGQTLTNNLVTNYTMSVGNNLREKQAVAIFGAYEIGAGEVNVTGTLTTYFDDPSLAEKIKNNTNTSLLINYRTDENHGMVYDMPRAKFGDGVPNVSGKNTDVTIPIGYEAIKDPDTGKTILVTMFEYVN